MSEFLDRYNPKKLEDVLGNKDITKNMSTLLQDKRSILLHGTPGLGKTCLAKLYFGNNCKVKNCSELSSSDIRDLRGYVVLDELQYLDKKKQWQINALIDSGNLIVVATTNKKPHFFDEALMSRLLWFEMKYPTFDDLKFHIKMSLKALGKTITDEQAKLIHNSTNDLRYLNTYIQFLSLEEDITDATIYNICGKGLPQDALEEYKSAMQKSIRGSDPNAAVIYALRLLDCGHLEEVCRRLRIVISEDVGLADTNCVTTVTNCLNNALEIGMPEAVFPITQAVIYLAIQPKSNSVLRAVQNYRKLSEIEVPKHIAYHKSYNYISPHENNNWVDQSYMPVGLEKVSIYEPNLKCKYESRYHDYWKNVKGREPY